MNSTPNILVRVMEALDQHEADHGEPARVIRLGRRDLKELDEYVRRFSVESSFGTPTGPKPNFNGVPIEAVDEDHFLSTESDPE
jgi:hypothetical protein